MIRHGIKYHVMLRLAVVFLTVLVSLYSLSYLTIQRTLQNNIAQKGKETSESVTRQINGALEDMFQLASMMSVNGSIQSFVQTTEYSRPVDRVMSVFRLMNSIKQNFVISRYINSYCIVDSKGNYYWSKCPYDDYFKNWYQSHVLQGKSLQDSVGFTPAYYFATGDKSSTTLISFVTNITQVTNGPLSTVGQVIINLDANALFQDVRSSGSFNQIGVVSEEGEIVYHYGGDQAEFLKTFRKLSAEGEVQKLGDYYIRGEIPLSGWELCLSFDEGQVSQTIDFPFVQMALGIGLCTMLFLFLLVFPFLSKISSQIVELDQAMSRVGRGDLETSVSLKGSREMENISQGFNEMVRKIKKSMQEALENEKARQQASFELLLAKINPHFIYNTLNSVIYLARKGRDSDIIELTGAFIYLLQDSIHPGENAVFERLDNEVEVIRKYVTIQKFRYADRFRFELDCGPDLEDLYLPKNILQPLIENSIIHGVCPKETPGTVRLSLEKEEDRLKICIEDDGLGMEQKKADLLLTRDTSENERGSGKMRSIGIRSIVEKLQFVYPGRYVFRIFSRPGEGMKIRIVIPALRLEELPPLYQKQEPPVFGSGQEKT